MTSNKTGLATFWQMNRCPKCKELILDWRKHFERNHPDIVYIHYLYQSMEMLRDFEKLHISGSVK